MKKFVKIITMILMVALCTSLVACSAYGRVQSALEDIGYVAMENEDSQEAENMQDESEVAVKVHLFSNKDSLGLTEAFKLNVVIVLEFNTTAEMKEFYDDSNTMQGLIADIEEDGSAEEFYNKLVEKGYASGNCLVLSINPLSASDVKDAIKAV